MRNKKKADYSHGDEHDDDQEAGIDDVEGSASINKKQRKHNDLQQEEEESTTGNKKKKKPNKPRKLNDALKDFQSNFGISSSSPSASTSTTPAVKGTRPSLYHCVPVSSLITRLTEHTIARATPASRGQNGFKSSFGDSNDREPVRIRIDAGCNFYN